jgi:hypothetical protein
VQQLRAGHGLAAAALSALAPLPLALLGLGLLAVLARLIARTSVYTLTSRRLVLRIGVALPIAFNIPFSKVASADLRLRPDGSGDIPLTLMPGQRLGFVALWPHVRPWRLNQPQPMMRGLADAAGVAELLCRAVGQTVPDLRPVPVAKATVQYT